MGLFNIEEVLLLKNAGVNADCNKEYTKDERKSICMQVSEYIMNHSSKNGDIDRLQNEYMQIFEKTAIK